MLRSCFLVVIIFLLSYSIGGAQAISNTYKEQYRPQIHFSPKEHWMNDPNGMVYNKGIYHLFFQYYPGGTVWGPMHWGHATSKDLIHWQQQPVALYPDSLGYIFSGSAVIDKNNTSGFGTDGKVPLVAIFTSHYPHAAPGATDYENQSLAYSLDNGKTWTKYSGNPVLKNPGISDFRDPKVMWYEPENKWVMTLATKDRVTFYSSKDLKHWIKESEFGQSAGAHGGVWECPDLFPLKYKGETVWILIVNLNPGGPNRGSATQYFTGSFDGHKFHPNSSQVKWIDYGPDEYAGVTWNNTGNRRIFLGWMSNWLYANEVPTVKWRNAMTIPRELSLTKSGQEMYVVSEPISELKLLARKAVAKTNVTVSETTDLSALIRQPVSLPCRIDVSMAQLTNFSIILSGKLNRKLVVGYDKGSNQYYIDRTMAGRSDFNKEFAEKYFAPRIAQNSGMRLSIIVDESSIELFADGGLSVMTSVFFPERPYDKIEISAPGEVLFNNITYTSLKSIWH
ncbi:MAG: glycoside hydrolase family 32 protein [Ginsengibacter sp.]